MTYAEEIVTILQADDDLTDLLTGGIYNYSGVGRKGIWRILQPGAFSEQTGLIKPICVVYEASEAQDGQAVSPNTGFFSTQTPVSVLIYNNGNEGFDTIDQAWSLIYSLLNNCRIPGGFQAIWRNTLKNRRDPEMKDAAFYKADFIVFGFRR